MSIRRTLLAALLGVAGLALATPATSFAAPAGETTVRSTHQGKKPARPKKEKKDEKAEKKSSKKKDPGFEM